MDAAEGVEALRIVAPRDAIPIHYDDYPVFKSPLEDFVRAVQQAGLATRVHYLHHGETFSFEVNDVVARPGGDPEHDPTFAAGADVAAERRGDGATASPGHRHT